MDCQYLRDGHQGRGVGPVLMGAVRDEARALGLSQVQWQTDRDEKRRHFRRDWDPMTGTWEGRLGCSSSA
jgi:GNAT superfamily N-acetyltransferase